MSKKQLSPDSNKSPGIQPPGMIPQVSTDTVTTIFQQIEQQEEIIERILEHIIEDTYESQDSLRGVEPSLHTMKSNFGELKKLSLKKKSNNLEQQKDILPEYMPPLTDRGNLNMSDGTDFLLVAPQS